MGKQKKAIAHKSNNWRFLFKNSGEEFRDPSKKQHVCRFRTGSHHYPHGPSTLLAKPKKVSYLTNKLCHTVGVGIVSTTKQPDIDEPTKSTAGEVVQEEDDNETYALINETQITEDSSKNQTRNVLPPLRPLYFEVPQEEEHKLVERHWICSTVQDMFSSERNRRGIIIHGNPGTGKTTITLQLVEHSCFGRKPAIKEQRDNSPLIGLASQIVAYHFCQVENRATCLVADFVHSVAAQMCQAPLLEAYRIFLEENPNETLSPENCLMNPTKAFIDGIMEPLIRLRKKKSLSDENIVLLVDSICEAESHRTSNGETIASFLSKHILKIPSWFKVIVTVRTNQLNILNLIPLKLLSLDAMNDQVDKDVRQYVSHRFQSILNPDKVATHVKRIDESVLPGLKTHLLQLSGGCFLFLKLTIDLIEQGHLVFKSNSFKGLPVSLHEVFLLHSNLRFPTTTIFNSVSPILSTCLVALNPLNLLEIYHSVNSLRYKENLAWVEFLRLFKSVQRLLVKRLDGTYMFFHSAFRDWLLGKDFDNSKFQCCPEVGHAAIALRMLRVEHPLNATKILHLGHHILKAKSLKPSMGSATPTTTTKYFHSTVLLGSCENISAALCSPFNIYNTNIKVSRLLLLSGASPTAICASSGKSILEICAAEGNLGLLDLLLEFGADIDCQNEQGDAALHIASTHGQLQVVHYLVENGCRVSQINSKKQCPMTVASLSEQLQVVNFFLDSAWDDSSIMSLSKHDAIVQSLVSACAEGCDSAVRLLLQKCPFVNLSETFGGVTPLIAACTNGQEKAVKLLLKSGANVNATDVEGRSPLLYAVNSGHYNVMDLLLNHGCKVDATDCNGRTVIMHAVQLGDIISTELLINQRCDINKRDVDGLCALSWACVRGNAKMCSYLLQYQVDTLTADNLGRTPLHIATCSKNEEIIQLLLDANAPLEHQDFQGKRPLDCAVEANCPEIAKLFLRKGVKLSANVWKKATNNLEMLSVFFNKLLEDGRFLLQNDQVADAQHRFEYALKKLNLENDDGEFYQDFRNALLSEIAKCHQKNQERI